MGSRSASLLQLQRSILEPGVERCGEQGLAHLPFDAGGDQFVVPAGEIERVLMPSDVVDLGGYSQLPEPVIGVVATDTEMLSVVDAGLLVGRQSVVAGIKARLLVFGSGPLKGVALLVDRVHARRAAVDDGRLQFNADEAYMRLQSQAQAKRIVKQ